MKENKTYGVLVGGWHVGCRQPQLKPGQLKSKEAKRLPLGHRGAGTNSGALVSALGSPFQMGSGSNPQALVELCPRLGLTCGWHAAGDGPAAEHAQRVPNGMLPVPECAVYF